MRLSLLTCVLLAACSKQPAAAPAGAPDETARVYVGAGRDALCLAGKGARAGLIVYGDANRNCAIKGSVRDGVLIPTGDTDCRLPIAVHGDVATVGAMPAACQYYCGPGASAAGKSFVFHRDAPPVVDLAGDPLC